MFNEGGEIILGNIQDLWIDVDIKGSFVNVKQKFNWLWSLKNQN